MLPGSLSSASAIHAMPIVHSLRAMLIVHILRAMPIVHRNMRCPSCIVFVPHTERCFLTSYIANPTHPRAQQRTRHGNGCSASAPLTPAQRTKAVRVANISLRNFGIPIILYSIFNPLPVLVVLNTTRTSAALWRGPRRSGARSQGLYQQYIT